MTHLETYLDCLKLLPGDLARDMSLLSSLDASLLSGQQSLRLQQQQLLEAFTNRRAALEPPPPPSSSPPPPWLSQLSAVRALEAELHLLCEEKVALALQVKEGLLSYAHRLDDETALSEKEMGGDMVREALEAGDRGKAKGGTAFAFRHGGASAKGGKGGAAMKEKGGGWREREKERERERQKAQLRSLQQQRRAEEEGDDDDLRLDPFDGEDAGDDEGRAPSTAPNLSEADAGDAADDGEGEGTGQEDFTGAYPAASSGVVAGNEPVFCFCRTPSYGDMVACDDPECKYEWFHYACVGLKKPPKGEWFCHDCRRKASNHV